MEAISQASSPMYLIPAYNKVYVDKEQALEDWNKGVDFKIVGGGYCSKRDALNLRFECSTLWIQWNRVDCFRIF
jgi:hypothetical protein